MYNGTQRRGRERAEEEKGILRLSTKALDQQILLKEMTIPRAIVNGT